MPESQVRWSYVTPLKQVCFRCEALMLGEGRVELVGYLRVPRDDQSDRGAFALRPIYRLQD